MTPVWICLGSNLGDREGYLREARRRMGACGLVEEAVSGLYETVPFGLIEQPPFVNQVVRGRWPADPLDLLASLKGIEAGLGRGDGPRWGPRPIDLDILLFGEEGGGTLDDPRLRIPHEGLAERAFVLVPLADVDPDLVLPGTGRTVSEHLRALEPWDGLVRSMAPSGASRPGPGT